MSETRLFLPAQQDTLASTVVTLRRMRRAAIEGVNPSSQSRDSWVHDTQAYFMQPDAFEDAALLAALAARFMISRGDGNSCAVDHEALKEKLQEDLNRYYHCFPVASYHNPPEAVVRQLDEEVRKLAQYGDREVRRELNKSNGRQPIESSCGSSGTSFRRFSPDINSGRMGCKTFR